MARLIWVCSVLALLLSTVLLKASGPVALKPVAAGLWLVGVVVLELASQPLPQQGRFHLVPVWTVGFLGALPLQPGLPQAALILWAALRSLLAGTQGRQALVSSLIDWFACLAWWPLYQMAARMELSQLTCWLVAALGYSWAHRQLLMSWGKRQTVSQSWSSVERILHPLRGLALCLGLGFIGLPEEAWSSRFLLLPGLLGFHFGVQNLVEVVLAQQARQQVLDLEEDLRQALGSRELIQREMKLTETEQALLHRLIPLSEVSEIGPLLVDLVALRARLNHLVLLWPGGNQADTLQVAFTHPRPQVAYRVPDWAGRQLELVQRDQLGLVANPAWFHTDRQAVLIPILDCALYLGQSGDNWGPEELKWIGQLAGELRPFLEGIRRHRLLRQRTVNLSQLVEGQQLLLECGRRLAQHLTYVDLWGELRLFLQAYLPLNGLLYLLPEARLEWGYQLNPSLLEWLKGSAPPAALSLDRAALAGQSFSFPGLEQLLCLPLLEQACLLVALGGEVDLSPRQLELLQGVGQLFQISLARAALHEDVLATQKRLEASQEMWLQSHKSLAMAQMAAGVAHELNTPLAAIRIVLESLALNDSPKTRERLSRAQLACEQAQSIIQRLGQLSAQQSEGGHSTDLVQVGRGLLEQLEPRLGGIETSLEAPEHRVCPYSKEYLETLLLPLLLNALEAVQEAPVKRLILRVLDDVEEVVVQVIDSGPGIPVQIRTRLSEPFFTTKKIGTNVGLGLSLVEQALRRCGGRWALESAPGQTCFELHLPEPPGSN
ncbi:MAG: HAMP domain-containing sensor histidine kinase [Vulcanimicrobiota bacterium]